MKSRPWAGCPSLALAGGGLFDCLLSCSWRRRPLAEQSTNPPPLPRRRDRVCLT